MSEPVDDLIARWLELRERGAAPDPAEFGAHHPECPELPQMLLDLLEVESRVPAVRDLPERVGRWRVVGMLGCGGAGIVLEASDPERPESETVAIKLLSPSRAGDERARARLRREARLLEGATHPNVVRVLEVVMTPPLPHLVLERIPGRDLRAFVEDARRRVSGSVRPPWELLDLPGDADGISRVVRLGIGMARGLAWAHDRGLVHRDMKPSNVMVRPDGEAVLLDFGLAADPEASALTGTGDLLGTPAYMAPEQARGDRVGPAADIYALGAVLFEALTLQPPVSGSGTSEVLRRLRTRPAPRISRREPRVPAPLAAIVGAAMAPSPRWRPPSAHAVAEDLAAFVEGRPVRSRPPNVWQRIAWQAWARPVVPAVGVMVLLLAAAVGLLLHARARDDARRKSIAALMERAALGIVEPLPSAEPRGAAVALAALEPDHPATTFLGDLVAGRIPDGALVEPYDRLAMAERSRASGDAAGAVAILQDVLSKTPSSLTWALLLRAARDLPDPGPTIRLAVGAAAAGDPASPVLQAGLGHLWSQTGEHARAAKAFARAARSAEEPGWLRYHEARARVRSGEGDEGAAQAAAAAGGLSVLLRFGRFLDGDGRRSAAQSAYREILRADPDRIDARFHLASSLASEEHVETAVREYREVLSRSPDHAPTLVALAYVHAWICGHEGCRPVHDPDAAMEYAVRAVRSDRGTGPAIVMTAAAVARHLAREGTLRPVLQELVESQRAAGQSVALLEDGLRDLDRR